MADSPQLPAPEQREPDNSTLTTQSTPPDQSALSYLQTINWRTVLRVLLSLAALALVSWLLITAWTALIPFQVGIVLAYLMLPLVNWLHHYVPRWLAIVLVYVVVITLIVGALAFVVPPLIDQATDAFASLPDLDTMNHELNRILAEFEAYRETFTPQIRQAIDGAIASTTAYIQENLTLYMQEAGWLVWSSTMGIINTVAFAMGFLIVPFWLFYVLHDQQAGLRLINRLVPERMRADFWAVLTIIDRVFSSYIRGQLLLGLVVGAAVFVGLGTLQLFGFGIQYALLLSSFAGIMELVPFIGPIIGAIPAVIVGFMDSPQTGLAVLVLFIIVQQLENNLLVPRVVGDSVGIHPAILMLVLVAVAQSLGFFWIILAAPLAAALRNLYRYAHGRLSNPPCPAGVLPDDVLLEPMIETNPAEPPPVSRKTPAGADVSALQAGDANPPPTRPQMPATDDPGRGS